MGCGLTAEVFEQMVSLGESPSFDDMCTVVPPMMCMFDHEGCDELLDEGDEPPEFPEGFVEMLTASCDADPCEVPDSVEMDYEMTIMHRMIAVCTSPCSSTTICDAFFEQVQEDKVEWSEHKEGNCCFRDVSAACDSTFDELEVPVPEDCPKSGASIATHVGIVSVAFALASASLF